MCVFLRRCACFPVNIIPKVGNQPVNSFNKAPIRKTLILLRSVNHKVRQRIIEIIGQGKKIVVTDICNEINLDQSAVSQHLAVLRQSGVVQTERRGKYIFYFFMQDLNTIVSLEIKYYLKIFLLTIGNF